MITNININNNIFAKKIVDTGGQQKIFRSEKNNLFGFWIYLMSDCIIFAVLFVVFIFMSHHRNDMYIIRKKIFSSSLIFLETIILLTSSLTCRIAIEAINKRFIKGIFFSLISTFFLGIFFIFLEFKEFSHFLFLGFKPTYHGFISSFYFLIEFHGFHVFIGLLWIIVILLQILFLKKIEYFSSSLHCFSLFWHFLDIIWIILISFVYL